MGSFTALDIPLTFEGEGLNEIARDKSGRIIMKVNPKFYRPAVVNALRGDSTKARRVLGWAPKIMFHELAGMMAKSDYELIGKPYSA